MVTTNQLHRTVSTWSKIAGETVRVEQISGALYAFCTELGALRLYYKMKVGRAAYSENRETWYYSLELNL